MLLMENRKSKNLTIGMYIILALLLYLCFLFWKFGVFTPAEDGIDLKVQQSIIKKGELTNKKINKSIYIESKRQELSLAEKELKELEAQEVLVDKRYKSLTTLIEMNRQALALNLD